MADYYVGEIRMWTGSFTPVDWLPCDGSLQSISQYQALFSLLGTVWGGDGKTTFGLPDLRGRVPVSQSKETGGTGLTARTVGQTGGAETVAVDAAGLPQHIHNFEVSTSPATLTTVSNAVYGATSGGYLGYVTNGTTPVPTNFQLATDVITNTGGGAAHTNVMPGMAINFIIAANGIYPQRAQ